jgi:hypothetical protein
LVLTASLAYADQRVLAFTPKFWRSAMPRIRSLKPNVTAEEAQELFASGGPVQLTGRLLQGPLRSVADVYIPFRLFKVELTNAGRRESHFLAIDAIRGNLDLYHFDQIPSPSEIIVLETRNCPVAALDDAQATELVIQKFRRLLFSRGFFRLRSPSIEATPLPGEIHVPYWVAFRGYGNRARLEVIDAVRRRYEGAKVRKLIEEWLASTT